MKRITCTVSGKVQGVFYRNHCKQEADKRGIRGYVQNMPDGTVRIVGEGDPDKLKEWLRECRRGPLIAFVQQFDIKESDATSEFDGFDIR